MRVHACARVQAETANVFFFLYVFIMCVGVCLCACACERVRMCVCACVVATPAPANIAFSSTHALFLEPSLHGAQRMEEKGGERGRV